MGIVVLGSSCSPAGFYLLWFTAVSPCGRVAIVPCPSCNFLSYLDYFQNLQLHKVGGSSGRRGASKTFRLGSGWLFCKQKFPLGNCWNLPFRVKILTKFCFPTGELFFVPNVLTDPVKYAHMRNWAYCDKQKCWSVSLFFFNKLSFI